MLMGRAPGLAMGAIVLSVGTLMSGCGPIRYEPPLPVAVRQMGGDIEVAVCESIIADRLYVAVRNSATNGEWLTLSELRGSAAIETGSVFRVGEEMEGMRAVVDGTPRAPLDGEDVNVNLQGATDAMTVFFAAVPWEDLDGDWFFTDGKSSGEPCGHYDEFRSTH